PSDGAARRAGSGRVNPPVRRFESGPRSGGQPNARGSGLVTHGISRAQSVTPRCHSSAQSVVALSRRLVRVRPLVPQLGAQLPGPGLAHRVLLKPRQVNSPAFFPRRGSLNNGWGVVAGKKCRTLP